MGFHVPPFISVRHLHLHVLVLPFREGPLQTFKRFKYRAPFFCPVSSIIEDIESEGKK